MEHDKTWSNMECEHIADLNEHSDIDPRIVCDKSLPFVLIFKIKSKY